MKRSIILVLDSLGLGSSADAHLYGDEGADTFGHIVEACAKGNADSNLRSGPQQYVQKYRHPHPHKDGHQHYFPDLKNQEPI
jgi:phosphopentomutase